MKKRINLVIEKCKECPYCQYDMEFSCTQKISRKSLNDDEIDEIPDWCPLEDIY